MLSDDHKILIKAEKTVYVIENENTKYNDSIRMKMRVDFCYRGCWQTLFHQYYSTNAMLR